MLPTVYLWETIDSGLTIRLASISFDPSDPRMASIGSYLPHVAVLERLHAHYPRSM